VFDHNLTVPKYDANRTKFVGLEVCVIGKEALQVVPENPCHCICRWPWPSL